MTSNHRVKRVPQDYPHLRWEIRSDGGELAGWVDALDGDTVWICHLDVAPDHRGHGYASTLLRAVLDDHPDTVTGLAAVPVGWMSGYGLTQEQLKAWYARHRFEPAPLRGDPHRMVCHPTPPY